MYQPMEKELITVSPFHLRQYNLHHELLSKYALGEELGSGGYGFVVSAREKASGIERAVKFIFRHKVPAHCWVTDRTLGQVPIEISVLKNVRHPSIIGYIDSYQDSYFCYLVMELHGAQWNTTSGSNINNINQTVTPPRSPALSETLSYASSSFDDYDDVDDDVDDDDMKEIQQQQQQQQPVMMIQRRTSCDLFECIERHRHFEEGLAKMIFHQVASCIAYLDLIGLCHRDIKDENIVIDEQYRVKLIDFGSAIVLPPRDQNRGRRGIEKMEEDGEINKANDNNNSNNSGYYYLKQFYGTISFASPEILLGQAYRAEPAEIWSLGVLLYTILFGEVPFHDPNMAMTGRFIQPKITVSSKCLHLISCMLQPEPEKRPTIHQVLTHPWFSCY